MNARQLKDHLSRRPVPPESEESSGEPAPAQQRVSRTWADLALDNIVWILLVVFVLGVGVLSPYFLTLTNLQNVLVQGSVLGLLALAVAIALLLGEIDLSVAGVLGVGATLATLLLTRTGAPEWVAVLAPIAVGASLGFINGLCIAKLRMNSLIETLAMGLLLGGAVLALTHGQTIAIESPAYLFLGNATFAGWPLMPLVLIAAYGAAALLLSRTLWGRKLYTTGGNAKAAYAAGVKVTRMRVSGFVVSGALAGAAGLLSSSYLHGVNPTIGSDLLLYAVAAPVIGGVSLAGGRGRVAGVFVGAMLLTVVQVGLQIVEISAYYVQMAGGAMILLAVFVDALRTRRASLE